MRAAMLLQVGQHMALEGCAGLRLVASASLKTWVYRYKATADGRMKQVALGQWPAVSAQAAVADWQALRADRASGIDPGQHRRNERRAARGEVAPAPAAYTVRRAVDDYIAGHLQTSHQPAGLLAATRALHAALDAAPALAGRAADSVTRSDAFDLLDARKATPTAAAKLRSLLGGAWDYALDAGWIPDTTPNWWRLVMRGRLKSKGTRIGGEHVGRQRPVLQLTEVAQLLAWLPNMHQIASDAVQLYLWTGARGAKIFSMRRSHITHAFDGWLWTVPKALTKNARCPEATDLRVPLVGRALAIVQRSTHGLDPAALLFTDAGGAPYTQHQLSTYIYDLQPHSAKVQRRHPDFSGQSRW